MKQNLRTWMIVSGLIFFMTISKLYSAHEALIFVLNAVIFIELYRMLFEFATKDDARIKIRYAIDAAFVFCIRELYLAWILVKEDEDKGLLLIKVYLSSMLVLLVFRWAASRLSPNITEKPKGEE